VTLPDVALPGGGLPGGGLPGGGLPGGGLPGGGAESDAATAVAADLASRLARLVGDGATPPPPPDGPAGRAGGRAGDWSGDWWARGWARSGAMALTGDTAGPPLAPAAPIADVMAGAALALTAQGGPRVADAPALLGERGQLLGLRRGGRLSCGGATRLLPAADGWVAVALARAEDWSGLPAWLGAPATTWDDVARGVAALRAFEAAAGAADLEIPVSVVAGPSGTAPPADPWDIRAVATAAGGHGPGGTSLVVDLSALWAGPLCADLLRHAGARVVKVEDPRRPDGARGGPAAFFDLLNAGKRSVAVDLASSAGRDQLRSLLATADVVVTSCRPRAMEQLGIDVEEVLAASPTVWVAITAYGWATPLANRVGFGDDVAAGAGLVAWHPIDAEPRFAGDAVADPLCGLLATIAATQAMRAGGSWFIDAPLVGAASYAAALAPAGPARAATPCGGAAGDGWVIDGEPVADPRSRPARGRAQTLGLSHSRATRPSCAGT